MSRLPEEIYIINRSPKKCTNVLIYRTTEAILKFVSKCKQPEINKFKEIVLEKETIYYLSSS